MYAIRSYYADGIDPAQLQRMKNRRETRFYGRMETVSGRTGSMAVSNMFLGDPTHAVLELQQELVITSYSIHYTKLYERSAPASIYPTSCWPEMCRCPWSATA